MSGRETMLFPGDTEGEQSPRYKVWQLAGLSAEATTTSSYLICTSPRTGSWMLATALAKTGLAGFPVEYFLPSDHSAWAQTWGTVSFDDFVRAAVREGTSSNGVFGAKLMWGHVHDLAIRAQWSARFRNLPLRELFALMFPDLRYVWLRRRDKVRQAVSHARAIQTGTWSTPDPSQQPPSASYDPALIEQLRLEAISEDLAWDRFFRSAGVAPLTLVYEDLIADFEGVVRRTLEFVGVGNATALHVPSPAVAQQRDAMSDAFAADFVHAQSSS